MKYDREIYAAIEGRPESHPQDLVGILWQVGQAKGILSEADQDRFPNHAELSFNLQSLIDAGRIAEASPHRYYDAAGKSHERTFTGISPDELERACTAYFQRLGQVRAWKLDVAHWPGPDRARWRIDRDIVSPSPDGQFACVLYSCAEVNVSWTVGLLALLKGPPEKPTILLRPPNFTCYAGPGHCVQWLDGSRYCVVAPYLFNQRANKVELIAITFLDLVNETYAHYQTADILYLVGQEIFEERAGWVFRPFPDPHGERKEKRLLPAELTWYPWHGLKGTRRWWQFWK